jgi:hypothetical protein
LDVRLDETDEDNQDGLALMHEIKKNYPGTLTIILTGYANVKTVTEALQRDADDTPPAFSFVEKSDMDKIISHVERAFAYRIRTGSLSALDLIRQGENDHIEFKSSIRWDYKLQAVNKVLQEVIATEIVGMLNNKGGALLIGVADDGTVLGIEKDFETLRKQNLDGFELAITDIVRTYLGVEHLPQVHIRFEKVGKSQVCVLSLDKSPTPVFLIKGDEHKFWVRMGNSTRCLDVKAAMSYIAANWKKTV